MERNSAKYTFTAAIVIMMIFASFFQVSSVSSEPITVTYDGKPLRTDLPPTVIQEVTMVSFRIIFEVLGVSVTVKPPEIPAGTAHDSQLEDK